MRLFSNRTYNCFTYPDSFIQSSIFSLSSGFILTTDPFRILSNTLSVETSLSTDHVFILSRHKKRAKPDFSSLTLFLCQSLLRHLPIELICHHIASNLFVKYHIQSIHRLHEVFLYTAVWCALTVPVSQPIL